MKKFQFSLDGVLSYKQQILDALMGEHAVILGRVHDQERLLEGCWGRYRAYSEEYRQRSGEGLVLTDALYYQSRLRAMEREIQQETETLEELRAEEEKKRAEVVEAKKDTSSIEKLKEKKLTAYHKAEAKSDEQFIEEFVNLVRLQSSTGT